jgi:Ca2+-binding RTX toxin-like protein
VMTGNAGNDLIEGDADRDILIGGDGADSLHGGEGQDLVIAAQTTYDVTAEAALAIREEWLSPDDYHTRVARLSEPDVVPPARHQLQPGVTVLDDDDIDSVFGGDETDWLLLDIEEDEVADMSDDEILTDISIEI